jgi:hypothetical protein
MHQHFALFQLAGDVRSFYIGFEDVFGVNGYEGGGDYNDAIFMISTSGPISHAPEPATFAIMGAGLIALGLVGRSRRKKTAPTA